MDRVSVVSRMRSGRRSGSVLVGPRDVHQVLRPERGSPMKRMMMGGAVLAAGVMAVALPPVLGAQASPSSASAAVHPSAAEILTRSTTAMAAVHRTHSEGTAYLWASGTNGNHIPSSTRVRVTGDCTIK